MKHLKMTDNELLIAARRARRGTRQADEECVMLWVSELRALLDELMPKPLTDDELSVVKKAVAGEDDLDLWSFGVGWRAAERNFSIAQEGTKA